MLSDYLHRILTARVYDVAVETPLELAPRLSQRLGNDILFKREDLQSVFSFKLRGAYNKLVHMSAEEVGQGVICASAGNHAQGVALAARKLGVTALIVMPVSTPRIKVDAVKSLGGEVMLAGDSYDDAYSRALKIAESRGLAFIHPFDDPYVIAGQGTIGMEIYRQTSGNLNAIFVPVGGGGLIAGVAAYIKSVCPAIRIIGVEPEDAGSMNAALAAGKPVTLANLGRFADGVAVRRVGDETFRLCREWVDEVILVTNDEICAAVQDIFEDSRAIVEPAGALAVAGLKRYIANTGLLNERFVTISSGANVNFDRLRHIAERAAIGEQREALFAVEIPEQRGSFIRFCETLGARNLTEFNYRYHASQKAQVFVGVELQHGSAEREQIIAELQRSDYPVIDISENELAKLHVRHMVGGRRPALDDEIVYRLEFQEYPGALLGFLQALGSRWNISLFHYRNHGADYGRVLVGVQVAAADRPALENHIASLNLPCIDETRNSAYRLFLGVEK